MYRSCRVLLRSASRLPLKSRAWRRQRYRSSYRMARGTGPAWSFPYLGHDQRFFCPVAGKFCGFLVLKPAVRIRASIGFAGLLGQKAELPVCLRDELLNLFFPVDDHGERGTLHPADRKDVVSSPACGKRDEPGQRRAPHEIDGLPGLTGRSPARSQDRSYSQMRSLFPAG